jgi:hypothetical protein
MHAIVTFGSHVTFSRHQFTIYVHLVARVLYERAPERPTHPALGVTLINTAHLSCQTAYLLQWVVTISAQSTFNVRHPVSKIRLQ